MHLPHPSEVVAAVTDPAGNWLGTAFFVNQTTALTCAHVVGDRSIEELRLLRRGEEKLGAVGEVSVKHDEDLARLRVPVSPTTAWLPLSRAWNVGARVVSHGFSDKYQKERFPVGHPMDPTEVSGQAEVEWRQQRRTVLRLMPSNADAGFSGGPVVDIETGLIIGVLRFLNPSDNGLYAIPASTVLDLWPDLDSDPIGEPKPPTSPFLGSWLTFDSLKLNCVVVESETARRDATSRLPDVLQELLAQEVADDIWAAFRAYWRARPLLKDGQARALPERLSASHRQLASINVGDAYTTRARLAEAVRLVVEADVAIFDMTGFEPGVMVLLGIRAATKRGVTVTSHGTWTEGTPLDRPFNLIDLPLGSHRRAAAGEPLGQDELMIERLGRRIALGFSQLDVSPGYQDLPAYQAVRELGPRQEAWSTIPLERLVLIMCSYDKAFYPNWAMLRRAIAAALSDIDHRTDRVARLIDLRRPQLVSQALYEHIRRCSACVTDWSGWSPSTFFELGVRLTVSQWGSVQIIDEQWLDEWDTKADTVRLDQHKVMRQLFGPLGYRGPDDDDIGLRIAQSLISTKETAGVGGDDQFIRSVVVDSLERVQEARPDVYVTLLDEADSLHHAEQRQRNTTQMLFPEMRQAKIEQEAAATQRRIAAWLYLEHRVRAGDLPDDDLTKRDWRALGNTVVDALYAAGGDDDLWLAQIIESRVAE